MIVEPGDVHHDGRLSGILGAGELDYGSRRSLDHRVEFKRKPNFDLLTNSVRPVDRLTTLIYDPVIPGPIRIPFKDFLFDQTRQNDPKLWSCPPMLRFVTLCKEMLRKSYHLLHLSSPGCPASGFDFCFRPVSMRTIFF